MDELDEWTQEQVASVPDSQRFLVTSHDSFGYFADRYGFEVVGVILSTTTEAEPSAEHLTELVEVVEKYNVPAVFGEATVSERLATSIAEESGAELDTALFRVSRGRWEWGGDVPGHGTHECRAHSQGSQVSVGSIKATTRQDGRW